MAVYKVPQDVEAEDKLFGPFSFRQFIYLIISVASAAMAFFLFQAFPLLVIIPLPIVFLFGILALPLRKDQPMETYLLAILRFYLKPKQRRWNPDGTITYVEITAPKVTEERLSKEYSGETARERLDYLARVMDSRGWALKGAGSESEASIQSAVAMEAMSATDVLDESAELSKSFETLIAKRDQQRHDAAVQQMQQAAARPQQPASATPPPTIGPAVASDENIATPQYNPYPQSMHQRVIQPIGSAAPKPRAAAPTPKPIAKLPASPVTPPVSPGIMRLATNNDLSISAIAHEAQRIKEGELEGEVVIKLH